VVYHVLKGGWSIWKSERQHEEFVLPVSALQGGFPFVTFCEMDQVIAFFEVDFRESFATTETILQLAHYWERVAVQHRDFVNSAAVNA
jgi:hypothetical protein